jgi:asparagine synthase (glutamine-hydrolysing)
MCGIVLTNSENIDQCMDAIARRGPDMSDILCFGDWKLGHTRLSILDVSESGRQPLISANERYVLSINGEIFNYKRLKEKLGTRMGHVSDSRVAIEYIAEFGLREFLINAIGMFAGILIDRKSDAMFAFKDRKGEKPLDYYIHEDSVLFSSDIYSSLKNSGISLPIDSRGIVNFLKYRGITMNNHIFERVRSVPPASVLEIKRNTVSKIYDFHDISKSEQLPKDTMFHDDFGHILKEYVNVDRSLVIPFSGGVDSTYVVMQIMNLGLKPKLFHVDTGGALSETNQAKKIAAALGLEIEIVKVNLSKTFDNIPGELLIADSSLLLSFELFKRISKSAQVTISGDGADELFEGYNKSRVVKKLFPFRYILLFITFFLKKWTFDRRIHLLASIGKSKSIYEAYDRIMSNLFEIEPVVKFNSFAARDRVNFLYPQVLPKVDRASMYWGVENRSPFLDDRLIQKYSNKFSNKDILIDFILKNGLNKSIFKSTKKGFSPDVFNFIKLKKNDIFIAIDNIPVVDRDFYKSLLKKDDGILKRWSSELYTILIFDKWYAGQGNSIK